MKASGKKKLTNLRSFLNLSSRNFETCRSAGDYCVYDQKASVNEKGRRSLDNPG